MKQYFTAGALAFATTTLTVVAQTVGADEATFVREAAHNNQAEIATAQAVLKTTRDPRVRGFANTMVADHSKANVSLRSAARKAGVPMPAYRVVTLGSPTDSSTPSAPRSVDGAPVDSGDLSKSGAKTGSSAGVGTSDSGVLSAGASVPQNSPQSYSPGDIAYLQGQVAAHEATLKLLATEAKSGKNAALKAYADDQTSTVRHHLDEAQSLLENGASPAPSGSPGGTAAPSPAGSSKPAGPDSAASHSP